MDLDVRLGEAGLSYTFAGTGELCSRKISRWTRVRALGAGLRVMAPPLVTTHQ